jgi:hypothetical protein
MKLQSDYGQAVIRKAGGKLSLRAISAELAA